MEKGGLVSDLIIFDKILVKENGFQFFETRFFVLSSMVK